MFLGIDVGTSAVKLLLVDAGEKVLAEASVSLVVSRPEPLFSEQDPEPRRTRDDALATHAGLREAQMKGVVR